MTQPNFILALDQGTTSSRAIVCDRQGAIVSTSQQETTQFFPQPGWVNQDATQIWTTTLATARDALAKISLSASDIAAIGIANQRETLIVWDRFSGQPAAPAIVWQSRQSQPVIDAIVARGMAPTYQNRTGLVPDAYFTASKLAWLLETEPELRQRAAAGDLLAGTVDSWLLWNLTGGEIHATDVSNASRTMIFDINTLEWSAALLANLNIPSSMLPQVIATSGAAGVASPELFAGQIPITGIAGDQQAALFGQTCFAPGDAKNTFGTGSFLLMNTGSAPRPSAHRLLSTIAWKIGDSLTYALEGAVFVSGAAVGWLRDGLGIITASEDVEPLAESVADSAGVIVVPALTGLGAPHWDAAARGTILGLTRGTTSAHIARATLEAIAFQTRDLTDAMSADSGLPLTSLRVDGGAARNDLLMQLQADLLGVPVVRPAIVESTALGAAFLAGLGSGFWQSPSELTALWQIDRVFEPRMTRTERDSRYAMWRRGVERSLHWADSP